MEEALAKISEHRKIDARLMPNRVSEPCQSLWLHDIDFDFSQWKELTHLTQWNCEFPIVYSPLVWLSARGYKLTQIPPSIGALTHLLYLNLQSTRIQVLPPEIGLLENLLELTLADNQIRCLPREFRKLKLVRLHIDHTWIDDLSNVNPIRLRCLGILYTKIQVFSMPACLDSLFTDQAISANYFKYNQSGSLYYTHPLPIELINTNVELSGRQGQFDTLK